MISGQYRFSAPKGILKMKPQQGDTVRIKSGGGPLMSVGCQIGDAHWMSWWDETLKSFRTEMLYLSQVEVVSRK